MSSLENLPSQDPVLDSLYEDVLESGHEEEIDNRQRGCDYLQHNALYVRSDVEALSVTEGGVPRFVELDQPVEFRETGERGAIIPGWKPFPGTEFALAYRNEGYTTTPAGAITDHHDRLKHLGFDGDHYGEITAARSHDLLMSVGATHWQTPEDYIEECREMGLNLKVPASPNHDPPVVNPMVTRCWVIHPNGVEEGRAGIIGYAVLTRCIYTTGPNVTADDPDVPTYAEEWAETGKAYLATPGEQIPAEEDEPESPDASIGDFTGRESIEDLLDDEDEDELPEFEDLKFWERYDIPVAFATAQNNRLSGLSKDSAGTGEAGDTVRHLYLLEPVDDGRLQRDADRFLCKGEGERPDRPSEPAVNPSEVTCSECLSLMERWKIEEGNDGD